MMIDGFCGTNIYRHFIGFHHYNYIICLYIIAWGNW